MSLKLVPFESLDAVFYSPSIVTVAVSVTVCEIFKKTLRRRLTYVIFSFNKKFNISHFHLQSLDFQFLP